MYTYRRLSPRDSVLCKLTVKQMHAGADTHKCAASAIASEHGVARKHPGVCVLREAAHVAIRGHCGCHEVSARSAEHMHARAARVLDDCLGALQVGACGCD